MKPIHLQCHLEAYQSLDFQQFQNYALLESDKDFPSSKWQEEDDLLLFVDELKKAGLTDFEDFDQFYYGYIIEHISKEFDLLRIGHNFCLNIELKHQSTQEKVLKQLRLNQYYLKSVFSNVYYFTYVVNTGVLYQLSDDRLVTSDISELVRLIKKQHINPNVDIDALFEPSQFLVSPFSQTQAFLEDRYFLTNQQQDFKSKICHLVKEKQRFIGLEGMAGTGKTLLLYDLAKTFKEQYQVAIYHVGTLSQGQEDLQKEGYHIYGSHETIPLDQYDILLIDEAQRLTNKQLQLIQNSNLCCIFAYDGYHLNFHEPTILENLIPKAALFKLSNHIRVNHKIMQFITQFFEPKPKNISHLKDDIEIQYFHDEEIGKAWLRYSTCQGYVLLDEHLPYAKHSSEIIGMDFDKIIIILDERFEINQGRIVAKNPNDLTLLYLFLTRAKKKIRIAIMNNPPVLDYCLSIINEH